MIIKIARSEEGMQKYNRGTLYLKTWWKFYNLSKCPFYVWLLQVDAMLYAYNNVYGSLKIILLYIHIQIYSNFNFCDSGNTLEDERFLAPGSGPLHCPSR